MTAEGFAARYGPWGIVAGASEGLGAAFATALSARGLNLVLVARRSGPLETLAATLPTRIVTVTADLATVDGVAATCAAAGGLEVGLVVANAAYSPIGRFLDLSPEQTRRAVDLNCHSPLALAHHFLPAMAGRGRGGFIVMSSLAGQQGSPPISVYAATKAYGAVLAEGLWAELRGTGVAFSLASPVRWPPQVWPGRNRAALPARWHRTRSSRQRCVASARGRGSSPVRS